MKLPEHTQGSPHWIPTRDGRRLFAQVLGGPVAADRFPTVVFEAGSGANRSYWAGVQQRTATVARSVVYDRAGLGRSNCDPLEPTLDRSADDLGDLLDHLAPGPFVLVGHSGGGPIIRLAASRRPQLVAGLVLVDPIDEAAESVFGAQFRRNERVVLRVSRALARFGVLRFLYRPLLAAAPAQDVRDDLLREAFTEATLTTQIRQARTYLDILETWTANPPELHDIPVTVVSGGLARVRDGIPKKARAEAITAHARRAAQSRYGRHVIALHSGHTVPLTEPQVVADEIERLVVRGRRD